MSERSDRLEREIEEILGKIERFPAPESRRARARKRAIRRLGAWLSEKQQTVARELSRVSISQVMLLAFLMILGSFFFRRFNPAVTQWVLYLGIILFISSFAIMVFARPRGSGAGYEQQWRGRTIRYQRATFWDRLRGWWARQGARRRRR